MGRPFLFDADSEPEVCLISKAKKTAGGQGLSDSRLAQVLQSTTKNQQSKILPASITPASRLQIRPTPEMASTGILEFDALTGGLPRGCLTELCGPASSGRTTVLLAALAAATHRGEFCALIDASDALDPHSAAAAGIDLDRLLWVRCNENSPGRHGDLKKKENQKKGCPISRASLAREVGALEEGISQSAFDFDRTPLHQSGHRLEQVLRATDLLLESGGFGLIVLDLADIAAQAARHIPLTTWFRFRRAVEHKLTILLVIEQQAIAGSCSSLLLQLGVLSTQYSVLSSHARSDDQHLQPAHAHLFAGLNINVQLTHSRLERKPARAVAFETKTAWAG